MSFTIQLTSKYQNHYSAEELEIQRQQEYSGFGEKIPSSENQFDVKQKNPPQEQALHPQRSEEKHSTEQSYSYKEQSTDIIDTTTSVPLEEIEVQITIHR